MKSIQNLLQWLNENWATITTIILLAIGLFWKIKTAVLTWQAKSQEEKEKAVKKAIDAVILSLVSRAEVEWDAKGMGVIKRAEVIEKLYTNFPSLADIIDQESMINYIDEKIKEALITVREKLRTEEGAIDG